MQFQDITTHFLHIKGGVQKQLLIKYYNMHINLVVIGVTSPIFNLIIVQSTIKYLIELQFALFYILLQLIPLIFLVFFCFSLFQHLINLLGYELINKIFFKTSVPNELISYICAPAGTVFFNTFQNIIINSF